MISYELCKQLREAGFPQDFTTATCMFYVDKNYLKQDDIDLDGIEKEAINIAGDCYFYNDDEDCNATSLGCGCCSETIAERKYYIKCPSLSELIEACGDRFYKLVNLGDRSKDEERVMQEVYNEKAYKWQAFDICGWNGGDTPEESVAKLWLKLNK